MSPLLVPKSNNTYRMCINYKSLDKQTIIPLTIPPNIQSFVRKLARFKYKTRIDLKNGYLQVPLHKHS